MGYAALPPREENACLPAFANIMRRDPLNTSSCTAGACYSPVMDAALSVFCCCFQGQDRCTGAPTEASVAGIGQKELAGPYKVC